MQVRGMAVAAAVGTFACALVACGGGSTTSGGGGGASASGGDITVVMGTAPNYLDPQEGFATQSANATWLAYLGLYTYAHESGIAGSKVIPALAEDYPTISADHKTYTIRLRSGLKYSNGVAVKASDFPYTIQRALKLNWGGKSFFTNYIAGSSEYDAGKADEISGIAADDATGTITIHLTKPYGAFLNVLAFPAAGFVPTGTKIADLETDLPPGVGPYVIEDAIPNRSFRMVRNPDWTDSTLPGVPAAHADVTVKIVSNTQSEAEQVLNNQADVFDWADQLPPSLLPQVKRDAQGRFEQQPELQTTYFFLNTQIKPFNNPLARQAVNYAVDRRALSRLNGGNFKTTCYFLPEGMPGHSTAPCPYGDPDGGADLAKARELVKRAGLEGQPVTVWGQGRAPRDAFVNYYADVLNQIGFKATPKIIADAQYWATIGNLKTQAQTGYAGWSLDFPNPVDFYFQLDANTIQETNNENFSLVKDPHIQSELAALGQVPTDELDSAVKRWQTLDEYVAKKAYMVAFGQLVVPKFYSDRIDFDSAVFHPVIGTDWSSLRLKK
jgi:peptide/nickel transport system substrate-binding protein